MTPSGALARPSTSRTLLSRKATHRVAVSSRRGAARLLPAPAIAGPQPRHPLHRSSWAARTMRAWPRRTRSSIRSRRRAAPCTRRSGSSMSARTRRAGTRGGPARWTDARSLAWSDPLRLRLRHRRTRVLRFDGWGAAAVRGREPAAALQPGGGSARADPAVVVGGGARRRPGDAGRVGAGEGVGRLRQRVRLGARFGGGLDGAVRAGAVGRFARSAAGGVAVGGRGGAGRVVTEPCGWCGRRQLVAVLLPGHEDVEAVVCLTCGRPQPVEGLVERAAG